MEALQISLFGKFHIQYQSQTPAGLDTLKVQELFCFLLLYRDRSHTREFLANLLWDSDCASKSRAYLRKALWQLQVALTFHKSASTGKVLELDTDWVRFTTCREVWLDLAIFEQVFDRTKEVPGRDLRNDCAEAIESAVALYKGEVLEGWYQDWCLCERERFQHMYLSMLDKLMSYHEAHAHYEKGLSCGMRILAYDQAHERTHRKLMRLHYLAGDRTEALRQFERCTMALSKEFGVHPSHRTKALYEQIRQDQVNELTSPTEAPIIPEAEDHILNRMLERLKELQAALTNLQQQVERDIKTVRGAFKR